MLENKKAKCYNKGGEIMKKIMSDMRKAVKRYGLIKDGDKIAVGVSGGKDSIVLLSVLNSYRKFSKEKFDLRSILN